MSRERNVLHDIREDLGLEPDLVLWRNSTGVTTEYRGDAPRTLTYGLGKGGADLVGILSPAGRFFALECKGTGGRLSTDQIHWLALVRRMGGFAAVANSVADGRAALERARRGEAE